MTSPSQTGREPVRDLARADAARFLRRVTHDLRQPIAAARTILSVLADGSAGPLSPPQADLVGRAERRLDFLQALVDDLIDLAMAQHRPGTDAAHSCPSLGQLAADVCGRFEAAARAHGVALECDAPANPLAVAADAADIALALDHLVSNAVNYSPGGTVRVSVGADRDTARLVVSDTGIGIPDEARLHLFDEFYRADGARALDPLGTGLGLAIVKAVVDRCGFTIDVESAEGRGTTVSVRIPLTAA
jgi:two-component system, OmpR family, phosphate regulon sensor histidine kinase PhoR